jgi:multiple sugar transport system substrate-binding protein
LKRLLKLLLVCILFTAALTGCGIEKPQDNIKLINPKPKPNANHNENAVESDSIELTIWSYYPDWNHIIKGFQQKYPDKDISVNVQSYTFNEYANKYLDALMRGEGPDVMVMDSAHLGLFNNVGGIADLQTAPYNAGQYRNDFSDELWNNHLTVDGEQLFALPLSISPMVTYYRADIMEDYGFPSEPEAFGEFIQDEEQWVTLAETLVKDKKWTIQWSTDPVILQASAEGLFNKEMEYLRANENFIQAVELGQRINQLNIDATIDMWSPVGQEAIREGKLALVTMGAYGSGQLAVWAPETKGLWRAARLPFGLHGFSGITSLAVPEASENKEWAWKFIEFAVTENSLRGSESTIPAFLPARNIPSDLERQDMFLGGQQAYKLYAELAEQMDIPVVTSITDQANAMWAREMIDAIEMNVDAAEAVNRTKERIMTKYKNEIEIIKELSTVPEG